MQIRVKDNVEKSERVVKALWKRQIPLATSRALNDVARISAMEDSRKDMEKDLDRPIPWTIRGQRYRRGNKYNQKAWVLIDPERAGYMIPNIHGGTRGPVAGQKGFVIGALVKRNKYGNVPRGLLKKMDARRDTFWGYAGLSGKGMYGLWQRNTRGKLKLLYSVHKTAEYTGRFDWRGSVERTIRGEYNQAFARRFEHAVKTAR